MVKISVIVPVYNAEKYLVKCIESVMGQTYSNWELILVNDGSKDQSATIIDRYAQVDMRIKGIHQKNAGPGIARNNGVKQATGEYVVFLDSDDYIERTYFELLASKDSDVVYIDVAQVDGHGVLLANESMSQYRKYDIDKIIRSQMTGKIPWGGVRKAVKRELIEKNNIYYSADKVGEEALYSFRVLEAANSVDFIEKILYFYVNHEGSQSKVQISDPWGGALKGIRDYLEKYGLYEKYGNTLNAFAIARTIVSIDRITQMYIGVERKIKIKELFDDFSSIFRHDKGIDVKSMDFKVKLLSGFVLLHWGMPISFISGLRKKLCK